MLHSYAQLHADEYEKNFQKDEYKDQLNLCVIVCNLFLLMLRCFLTPAHV